MTKDGRRINIALEPRNDEFVRVGSRATGRSATSFVNAILAAYQSEHPELMQQARVVLDIVRTDPALAKLAEGKTDDD